MATKTASKTAKTKSRAPNRYVAKLETELNKMVNEQFQSAEFRYLLETPLTLARARFYTVQLAFYALNRRDCWAYVQARAPLDVKQAIWHHEEDELIRDSRGGADHVTLMNREALALGLTEKELVKAQPSPSLKAALLGFSYLASNLPWLGGLVASHFLERRNNNTLIKSKAGGSAVRWRDRLINELGIDPKKLISTNVHAVADEEHSDLIWDTISRHVKDEESYKIAVHGARESAQLDRAVRAAFATGMRMIAD
ncbi:MAG: iron-containing redox enzyme family protein [Gemmatimonas sp.]